MFKTIFPVLSLATLSSTVFAESAGQHSLADHNIEEVFVTAEFREDSLITTAASISVLNSAVLEKRNATHIEDVINLAPNVNFSSGASRGRFYQIRGIGERSQFIEPVNASVGIVIDDIDFTGLGGAATTLDIQQVEILRGPQGTLMGANALAGLIQLKSEDPTAELSGSVKLGAGNYATRTSSLVTSAPITEHLGFRFAVEKNTSDGFTQNRFLHRADTNNIDEITARGKVFWRPSDNWNVKLTGYIIETDNGYDAFSLDNTRETLSDEPGKDTLHANAFSLSSLVNTEAGFDWKTVVSYVDADMEYSYDEDWANLNICQDLACAGSEYSSKDQYLRGHRNTTFDTRFISTQPGLDWVAGVYYREQTQELTRVHSDNENDFSSDYDIQTSAVYGQLGIALNTDLKLVAGARIENFKTTYSDTLPQDASDSDNFVGGKIALEYTGIENTLAYGLISSGYKAGGYNIAPNLPQEFRHFASENMINYEIGFKEQWWDGKLQALTALFYQDRTDIQTKQYYLRSRATGQVNDPCPCDFDDYLANAAEGDNYGLETEIVVAPAEAINLWFNLGLLKTEFKNFKSFSHNNAAPEEGIPYDLSGRAQPHAPEVQLASGFDIDLVPALTWSFDIEHKSSFYFSASHNSESIDYTLYNSRLTYTLKDLQFSLWVKNLSNEITQTRGFYFGNDPRDKYEDKTYYQFGAPRTYGATLRLNLP